MRVIARPVLRDFAARHPDAKPALDAWWREARAASWATPADIKRQYRTASILKGGRVVFDIAGNKYRLVVQIHFRTGICYIRFIGTHAAYDRIDAETI